MRSWICNKGIHFAVGLLPSIGINRKVAMVVTRLCEPCHFWWPHSRLLFRAQECLWLVSSALRVSKRASTEKLRSHFPGLKGLGKAIVWVFPKLLICLHCGFTESGVPDEQKEQLKTGSAPAQRSA
jgi:hypothetical protein